MKILIAYHSKTGNTKKIAEAISDALKEETPQLKSIKEVDDPAVYDFVILGFPVSAHSAPVSVQNFIRALPEGIKLAIFSTHGSQRGSRMAEEAVAHATGLAKGVKLLGSYTCRGAVDPGLLEELTTKPEHRAWVTEAQSADGHPDEADLEDAATFARSVLKKALSFSDFNKK